MKSIRYKLLKITKIASSDFDTKVQVGDDQEKAQSEIDSHSKKPRWEMKNVCTKEAIRSCRHSKLQIHFIKETHCCLYVVEL